MNLKEKLAHSYYNMALAEKDVQLQLYFYWNTFIQLVSLEKRDETGLRQSIRDYLEDHFDEIDPGIDYDDERLDEYFNRPFFADGHVDKDKDIYYYLDYNMNQVQFNRMNDMQSSIRNFQKLYNDMDINALFMTILKVVEYMMNKEDEKLTLREKNLIAGAVYILNHTCSIELSE